jgi:hypothetical protein
MLTAVIVPMTGTFNMASMIRVDQKPPHLLSMPRSLCTAQTVGRVQNAPANQIVGPERGTAYSSIKP